jgi:hypothetical protein
MFVMTEPSCSSDLSSPDIGGEVEGAVSLGNLEPTVRDFAEDRDPSVLQAEDTARGA